MRSEADFDKYDRAFLEFFEGVPYEGEIPPEMMDWLNRPPQELRDNLEGLKKMGFPEDSLEELLKTLEERIRERDAPGAG